MHSVVLFELHELIFVIIPPGASCSCPHSSAGGRHREDRLDRRRRRCRAERAGVGSMAEAAHGGITAHARRQTKSDRTRAARTGWSTRSLRSLVEDLPEFTPGILRPI